MGEACDDGNLVDGDGCQASSALPTCGDGVLDAGETCDDGNSVDGDGCNALCSSDETCGNSVVDPGVDEACDDGNTIAGDGCSATCQLEQPDTGGTAGAVGAAGSAGTSRPGTDIAGTSLPGHSTEGGCGCRTNGGRSAPETWLLGALAALALTRRRRRWM